jgi:hypothetical protein
MTRVPTASLHFCAAGRYSANAKTGHTQNKTWRATCFVHVVSASFLMTRTFQSIRRMARASHTKAVQQSCRGHMRPVVARWSKFTDAGCLA